MSAVCWMSFFRANFSATERHGDNVGDQDFAEELTER